MSAHSPRFDELLPAHALGALDGDDLRELEAHMASGCPECRGRLAEWRRDLERLAGEVEPVAPSEIARRRVLAAVAGEARVESGLVRTRRPQGWWLAAAAALLVVIGGLGLVEHLAVRRELDTTLAEKAWLEQRLAESQDRLARALAGNERLATAVQTLTARDIRPVVLAGLEPAPGAVAHSFVNPEADRALFYAYDLPPLPPDRTYQLWIIADGRPVSAGTFEVDARGAGSLEVDGISRLAAEGADAWAVTVEPEGGVPQPTGAMVLKG